MRSLSSLILSLSTVCLLGIPAFAAAPAAAPAAKPETPAATAPAQQTKPAQPAAVKGSGFHGNTQTHVFHASNCRYYNSKSCTEQFATADEAVKKGYKPCKICIKK